jgi:hypothetical protein
LHAAVTVEPPQRASHAILKLSVNVFYVQQSNLHPPLNRRVVDENLSLALLAKAFTVARSTAVGLSRGCVKFVLGFRVGVTNSAIWISKRPTQSMVGKYSSFTQASNTTHVHSRR